MSLPEGWAIAGWQAESGQAWIYRVQRVGEVGGRQYALKRLKNPMRRERFVREVEAMRRLHGEHGAAVPEIMAADLEAERPWFVMPWYSGGSLENAVGEGRFRATLSAGFDLLLTLSEILADIHAAGVAHRDLKPANVLVADDRLAVTDFGLCLDLDEAGIRLTDPDEAVGSRLYVAPENEAGINLELDQRPSDFYAFGKLAWALLAGRQPLPRERILEPDWRLVTVLADRRLEGMDDLLRDLLNRDPRARLKDWTAVLRELRSAKRAIQGIAEPVPRSASERAVAAARRLVDSATVQSFLDRRSEDQRRQVWSQRLVRAIQEHARFVEPSLAPINRELGDILSMTVTTGGPTSREQLSACGLEIPPDFLKSQPLGDATGAATCLVIHSGRGIESFPTIVVRLWPSFSNSHFWIARVPEVTHRNRVSVAAYLAPWLFGIFGPFEAFRQSSLEEAATIAEETARVFVTLAEQYVEIVDGDQDPTNPEVWRDRKLAPAELVLPATPARGDTQPPDLRSFNMTPSSVEITDSPAAVVCRARIVDELAGVAGEGFTGSPSQARLRSPSGQLRDVIFDHRVRVSGDALDGVYEATLLLSAAVERGFWEVEYVMVVDQAGNARTYRGAELRDLGFASRLEVR